MDQSAPDCFVWTFPLYILAGNFSVDDSGNPTFHEDTFYVAPKADGEHHLAIFTDAGTINIDGGSVTLRGPLNSIGGDLNFTSGALSIIDNFTVGTGGRLGADVMFDATRSFTTSATTTIDASHTLTLNGGTFNTGSLVANGTFTFNSGTLGITGAGGLTIGSGGPLGGTFVLGTGQALHITNTLTVNSGADLTVHSVAPSGFSAGSLVNNGDLVVINSAVNGPVVNNNAVTVVGSVDFNGPVSGPGNFYGPGTAHFNGGMSPGASPDETSFEGNVALGSGNTLLIELGGTTKGTQYDALDVAGSATLAGIVDVSLINGFTPIGGQQFTILAASSIANNGLALTAADAGLFNLIVGSTSVVLQAIGLPGDYNQNGIVDAADYVVWRKYQGTNNTLPNDLIGGTIGTAQYDQWRSHFGQASGSGSALPSAESLAAAVPEPATVVLLALSAVICLQRRRTTAFVS